MKTIVKVSCITHDDLVNLFSTALYGSSWLGCEYRIDNNAKEVPAKDGDCYEDRIADVLLAGKKVELLDRYAEDESEHYNSAIPHHWDEDEDCMIYTITLKDIEDGLSRMSAKYVMELINADDDGDFDQPQAESIIQHILWGEEIYG